MSGPIEALKTATIAALARLQVETRQADHFRISRALREVQVRRTLRRERRVVPFRSHELTRIKRKIMRMAARLRSVVVENMEFEKAIGFYDSPQTLFYADPPYPGHHAYRVKFSEQDFDRLVESLRGIRGKMLLSISEEHRRKLKGFRVREIHMRYTLKGAKPGPRTELLAMNF